MKNIFIASFVLAAFTLISCEKEGGRLDPNATLSIRAAAGVKAEGNPNHLTAAEIVKTCWVMSLYNDKLDTLELTRGFADHQRDTVEHRLLMYGSDVVTPDGRLTTEFIEGRDFIFCTRSEDYKRDTVAYIPNAVIRTAETAIKKAYAEGDYTTCYNLLDQAFRFTPITGAEWRALKATGDN